MNSQELIQRDLHDKLAAQLQDLMNRETAVMLHVLPPTAVCEILLRAAAGVGCGVIGAMLQMSKHELDASETFDIFAAMIGSTIASRKPDVMDAFALIRSGQPDEAIRKYGAGARR